MKTGWPFYKGKIRGVLLNLQRGLTVFLVSFQ